jgi:UDP-N-acetylmuramate dehydrogenase
MSAIDELVARGANRVEEHADLGARTTYRVGGRARLLLTVSAASDLDDLGSLIIESGLALLVVGNGSNLLVADGEHDLIALRLQGELATLTWREHDGAVRARLGGGLDLPIAARRLVNEGIVGFEWAVGVPGTLGGAVTMNAGGHGSDIAASLIEADVWRSGEVTTWSPSQLRLAYRSSAIESGDVVLGATLALSHGDADEARARVREIVRWRREHQPGGANAGSVFRNPPEDYAARLIEAAGCKGLRVASAQVSEKHANFIQADAGGLANDVYALMGEVRERVRAHSGIELEYENRFVGFAGAS